MRTYPEEGQLFDEVRTDVFMGLEDLGRVLGLRLLVSVELARLREREDICNEEAVFDLRNYSDVRMC